MDGIPEKSASNMASLDAALIQNYDGITIGGQARTINGNVHGNITFHGDVVNNYSGQQPSAFEDEALKDETLQHLFLQSLAFLDMDDRRGNMAAKVDRTCEWILREEQYVNWKSKGGLLWIKGGPGTGKSTIMNSLVTKEEDSPMPKVIVASFFFHRRGTSLQHNTLGMLRFLLHQILDRNPGIREEIIERSKFVERCEKLGKPGNSWNWTETDLREHLATSIDKCTQSCAMRLYVDALDEAGEATAICLIEYFNHLQERAGPLLSICISCRPYPDVIWDYSHLIIVEHGNQQDIALYLDRKFETARGWGTQQDMNEIKIALQSRSSGVFQWIVLVTSRILRLRREKLSFILDDIKKAPKELGNLYEEMLSQLSAEDQRLAFHFLSWVTLAAQPLTVDDLRYAVSIDSAKALPTINTCKTSPHWCNTNEEMSTRLLRLSLGLVTIVQTENGDQTLQYNHESVQEYMHDRGLLYLHNRWASISNYDLLGQQHHRLAVCCIHLLGTAEVLDIERPRRCGDVYVLGTIPLLAYAAYRWMHHAKVAEAQGICQAEIIQITRWPSSDLWSRWTLPSYHSGYYTDTYTVLLADEDSRTTLQHVAARFGLNSVLTSLIPRMRKSDIDADINTQKRALWQNDNIDVQDGRGMTPLMFAAWHGHEACVKILLDTFSVNVNAKNEYHGTPFILAAAYGQISVVKLLLGTEKVAINGTDARGKTALLRAVEGSRGATVKLLLDTHEADVNIKDKDNNSPLSCAVGAGDEAMVRQILKSRPSSATINQKDKFGEATLAKAARHWHRSIVKLLLDTNQADVNMKDREKSSPLSLAVAAGDEALVRQMLEIDHSFSAVNTRLHHVTRQGRTPLMTAARAGNEAIVRLLVDTGRADINARTFRGSTALLLATQEGHAVIAQLLVTTASADINIQDSWGSTALIVAAQKGREAIARLLIDTGSANINTQDRRGCTALMQAAQQEHEAIVRLLISTGSADVDTQDSSGWTALMKAARSGHEIIAQLLLDTGRAEVNRRKRWNETALMIAADNGHEDIVRLIIDTNRADINSRNIRGETALMLAVYKGDETIVQLLLATGQVDVNITEYGRGRTPLKWAAVLGHVSVVKLLLANDGLDIAAEALVSAARAFA